jgi:chemotaxis protein methyltransferase CheR
MLPVRRAPLPQAEAPNVQLSSVEFAQLRDLVHTLCGLALTEDKAYLVRNRLGPVATAAACKSFTALLKKLAGPEGPSLREPIIEAITTKETSFFRDGHPFETFRRVILPELGERWRRRRGPSRQRPIRIWSSAVSTGQEAYSVAMLVDDYLASEEGAGLQFRDFAIVATDISVTVLDQARSGIYTTHDLTRGVDAALSERYFRKDGQAWKVVDRLRDLIEFRKLNLMDDFTTLGGMDLIFCRNVLIYFDDDARTVICDHLASMLPTGGRLILGAVENLYGLKTGFTSERLGQTLVYRKG